jgi:thioredoxin-related protein
LLNLSKLCLANADQKPENAAAHSPENRLVSRRMFSGPYCLDKVSARSIIEMRMKLLARMLALVAVSIAPVLADDAKIAPATEAAAAPENRGAEYPSMGPDIYDTKADAAKLLSDAVAKAKDENKRVLALFGGNWCIWCQRLHRLMATDAAIAKFVADNYVVVMVDVSGRDEAGKPVSRNEAVVAKYGVAAFGYPALVVISNKGPDGNPLVTYNSGLLEEGDHHSPEKVMAFLKAWVNDPACKY